MSGLLAWILCCGMCILVFSDDNRKNCIFDWQSLSTEGNSSEIVVDYSGMKISTLTEGRRTYHYMNGPIITRSLVDDSYDAYYSIQKWTRRGSMDVLHDVREFCYFKTQIYPEYLLPIAGSHNDFPPESSLCPMQAGTLNIFPANSSKELIAPSKLGRGKYYLVVSFLKNNTHVGGLSGNFTVIPCVGRGSCQTPQLLG